MAGTVHAPAKAWIAVVLMIVGFTVGTVAFVARLWWLLAVGAVIGLAGVVVGKLGHIMEAVEEH